MGLYLWRYKPIVNGVELRGLEPLTPTLPVWCATSCATAPWCSGHPTRPAAGGGSPGQHEVLGDRAPVTRPVQHGALALRGGAAGEHLLGQHPHLLEVGTEGGLQLPEQL